MILHEEKMKKEKKVPIIQRLNPTQETEGRTEVMEIIKEVRVTETMTIKIMTEEARTDKEIMTEEVRTDKETSATVSRAITQGMQTETLKGNKVNKDRVCRKDRTRTDLLILTSGIKIPRVVRISSPEIQEMISLIRIRIRMKNLLHKDREDLKRVLKKILFPQWTVHLLKRPALQG